MALNMGAAVTVIILAFMLGMLRDKRTNAATFTWAALVFLVGFHLARSQRTIGDVACMKATIALLHRNPHERAAAHRRLARAQAGQFHCSSLRSRPDINGLLSPLL